MLSITSLFLLTGSIKISHLAQIFWARPNAAQFTNACGNHEYFWIIRKLQTFCPVKKRKEKKHTIAPARWLGWSSVLCTKWFWGLIPGQRTYPGCGFSPHLGCVREATSRCFSLSISAPKSINIYLGEFLKTTHSKPKMGVTCLSPRHQTKT